MNSSPRMLLFILCVLSLLIAPLYAQKTTGTITGVISDPSGAVVANATVTASNPATGQSRTVNVDQSGTYRIAEVDPGVYRVTVKAQGFKETVVNSLEVHVSSTTNQNFTMQAGGATETIEVTANPIQVQTDTATLGEVINDTQVKELPLNGRNFVELTQLAPGVSGANNFNSKDKGLTGGVDFSVNGNSTTNNLFLVDGANNNDVGSNRTILIYPAVESISEFKMLRNSFGPEYGQASGSVISIITKGGSNQLHGSVFYSGRNDALSAYDYFTKQNKTAKAKLRRNDYGFTLGGPIVKDRLFFFASEEWNKESRGIPGQASCVPTAAERAGDFSAGFTAKDPTKPTVLTDQCGAPQPVIPVGLQAPGNPFKFANPLNAGLLLVSRLPDPNLGSVVNGNNWSNTGGRKQVWRQDSFRGDWQVSKNNSIMGRYTQDHWNVPAPAAGFGWGDDPFPALSSDWQQPSKMIVGKLTSTIGTSIVNDAEFAYSNNRINITVGGTNPDLLAQIDKAILPIYPESLKNAHLGLPVMWGSFGSYAPGNYWTQSPWSNSLDIYTVRDDLSKVAGSHTWKAGLFMGWDGKNEDISNPGQGERAVFGTGDSNTSIPTGNNLANVMVPGAIWNLSENSTNIRGKMRWRDYEFYVGDTWKATKKLTIEYGARYSFLFTPYDADNRGSSFQPFLYDPTKPSGDACNGMWVVPGTDPCTAANKLFGTKFSVAPGGPNKYLINQNHHLIAPRVGMAWDPFGHGTTAVHIGAGQFFQRERVSPFFILPNNAPYALSSGTIKRTLDGPTAATAAAVGGNTSPQGGRSPESLTPNSWQWNISVEHSFAKDTALQIAYVGNRAIHQIGSYDINQPDPSNWAKGVFLDSGSSSYAALRPYSNFNELGYWNHAGSGSYHSLQTLFKTRYKRSQLTAAYTWSHSIANVLLDDSSGSPNGIQEYISFPNTNLDKGNSAINRPHIFIANFTYYLPDMKGSNKFVHAILGGWELSGIQQATSGNSQSIYVGSLGEYTNNLAIDPATGKTFVSNVHDGLLGSGRLDMLRPMTTGVSCESGRNANHIYNPEAFTVVGWKLGSLPSNMAPRGYCHGPRTVETDFSIDKNWKMTEKVNVQFRLDAFNLFNHPNFRGNTQFQGNPFQGFNCGPADAGGKFQPCSALNNVVSSQTRTSNFGISNSLVGDAGREFQYSLKFSF
jgi:Carboxypeptidase regulatory-like domain